MMNKRGQVTIFIIIAVIVVGAAALFYMLSPKLGIDLTGRVKNPQVFIRTCVEEDLEEIVESVSLQGGSLNPEHYFTYNNIRIEYLCYINQYYAPCIIQQPLLKQHIEEEINTGIENIVDNCFNALKESYEDKGYDVVIRPDGKRTELLPKRIILEMGYSVILTKDESEEYTKFNIILNNNLYELIAIANSILEWETTYGDADPTIYMTYYPDLKVEKNLRDDGTTIYILTDRPSGDKFQFASRSVAWPAGY